VSEAPTPARHRTVGLGRLYLIAFLALALIPALFSLLALYQRAGEALEQASLRQVESLAELKRIDLQDWSEQRARALTLLANDTDLVAALAPETADTQRVSTWLQEQVSNDPEFDSFMVVRASDGGVWATSQARSVLLGKVFPGWAGVRHQGISPARYEPALDSDALTILFATPIVNTSTGGDWLLIGEAAITRLQTLIASQARASNSLRAFVITAEGDPLIGVNGAAPEPLTGEVIRAAVSAPDGSGRYAGNDTGQTLIAAHRWLGDELGLALIVAQDNVDAVAPLSGAVVGSLAVLFPTWLAAAVVAWWLIRRRLAPLPRLADAARRLAANDLSITLEPTTQDEIGDVTRAFNEMAEEIQRRHSALQTQIDAHGQWMGAAREVRSAIDMPQRTDILLARAINAIQEQFEVDIALVFLREGEAGDLRLRAGTETMASRLMLRGLAFAVEPTSVVGWVAVERTARFTADVREDDLYAPTEELAELRAAITLPLITADEVIGAILLGARRPSAFSERQVPTFQVVADFLAAAIVASRQYERSQRTRLVEDVVVALAGQVSQTTDPERILTIGARVLGSALDARRATIRMGAPDDIAAQPRRGEEP